MSRFWTWSEIKTKITNDLDLADEVFVTEPELLAYANEAIDEAEAEIHDLYEDYFLSKYTIPFVQGTADYDLPTDIYGHKIRRLIYQNGATIYAVDRLRDWKKFEEKAVIDYYGNSSTDFYNYFITNSVAGSPKMSFVPAARESGSLVTVWYIRNANELAVNADVCDIPEFINFVFQYMKTRIYEKEMNPNVAGALAALEAQRELMQSTLASMVPDADNRIEMDTSVYEEMS